MNAFQFWNAEQQRMPTTKHRLAVNLDDQEFADLAAMAEKHDVSLA